jgi:hypothetical protein
MDEYSPFDFPGFSVQYEEKKTGPIKQKEQ